MSKSKKRLFVQWCAKDAIDGMIAMDPWTELAYRRIIDLIYATNNNLRDDDKMLAIQTKVGIARWRKIKAELTNPDDQKIYIFDGKICNERCDLELRRASEFSDAQKRRAYSRYSLKTNNSRYAPDPAGELPGDLPESYPEATGWDAGEMPTVNRKLSKSSKNSAESPELPLPDRTKTVAATKIRPKPNSHVVPILNTPLTTKQLVKDFTKALTGKKDLDPVERKIAWQSKIIREAERTMGKSEYQCWLEAWGNEEPWAKTKAEEININMRADEAKREHK